MSQIFKEKIPNELLKTLLEEISIKTEKYYIISHNSYKKGLFNNCIHNFINQCKTYYHMSKRKYIDRKLTYKSFVTIIRQICNFNNIFYKSQIKYDKSDYDIIYYIFLIDN